MKTDIEYQIEKSIRDAIITKRAHDKVATPKWPKDNLGRHIVIPNDERSPQDVLEDHEYIRIVNDEENMKKVYELWLPVLRCFEREIVLLRCSGHGWKSIAHREHCSRHTAMRYFKSAIYKIEKTFFF